MAVNNGVEEISEKQFEEKINNKLVVIDFYADWCMPCLIMVPILEELSEKFEGKIKFGRTNVDENRSLAQKFKIMSIPCLIIFRDGKEAERVIGTLPSEHLEEKLRGLVK